jgi:hypothetical protein
VQASDTYFEPMSQVDTEFNSSTVAVRIVTIVVESQIKRDFRKVPESYEGHKAHDDFSDNSRHGMVIKFAFELFGLGQFNEL